MDFLRYFQEILHEFLDAVITELGYDVPQNETLTRTLNRFYVLSFACSVGHKGCIDDAIAKYQTYRNGNPWVIENFLYSFNLNLGIAAAKQQC